MVVQDFRNLLSAQPFQPFRVVMSSGKAYEVHHPELASVTRTKLLLVEPLPNGRLPDNYTLCSLLHVTNVEPIEEGLSAGRTRGD